MTRLDGRIALITGAGGGIGRALVGAFTKAGATVVACDRDKAGLPDPAYAFDLTDRASVRGAVREMEAEVGPIDVLVNNAGATQAETLDDLDAAAFDAETAVNLTGTYNVTAPILAAMRGRGRGSIVFVASINATHHCGNPAYAAAKAGMLAYMRAIAVEAGRSGVRANAVAPGSVRTPAWDHRLARDPGLAAKVARLYPLERLVTPAEVASAVLFLASDAASGVTGAVLPVDGGLGAGCLPFVDAISGKDGRWRDSN